MINVAIAGCGSIASKRHAPEYKANPGSRICGFYDFVSQRAAVLQAEYGGKVYADYADMLADPKVDAVSVCTANKYHAPMTIQALQAGKHVLCEKPMALSTNEAKAMREAETQSGKMIMVGHNQRFTQAHIKARELLTAGKIGKILTFKTCFGHSGPENWGIDKGPGTWFFDKNQAFVGSLGDLGVHKIDLLRFLLGDEIAQVVAMTATLDKKDTLGQPVEVDDNVVSLVRMKGGAVGSLICSWTYYGEEDNSTILYGDKGIMKIYNSPDLPLVVIKPDGSQDIIAAEAMSTNQNQQKSGVIDAFITALEKGTNPAVTSLDGLETIRVVEALLKSARTGSAISLI